MVISLNLLYNCGMKPFEANEEEGVQDGTNTFEKYDGRWNTGPVD